MKDLIEGPIKIKIKRVKISLRTNMTEHDELIYILVLFSHPLLMSSCKNERTKLAKQKNTWALY